MGNLCRFTSLVALTKPEQPTAAKANTTLKKTQGKHAGATGNRQQQAPTHRKVETLNKNNVYARRVYTRRAPNTTADSAYMFEAGCRTNLRGIAAHIVRPTAIGCLIGNKHNIRMLTND